MAKQKSHTNKSVKEKISTTEMSGKFDRTSLSSMVSR